jgi:hypothetical protein
VSILYHQVNLIGSNVKVEGVVKLSKHLHILVIPECHQVREAKLVTSGDDLIKLWVMLCLQLLPVNILYLHNIGLLKVENHKGIEVGMKLIPKHVINPLVLGHNIGIFSLASSTSLYLLM